MNPKQWLDEHGDALYAYAMQKTRDSELAADLVQETLLASWKSKESFSGQSSVRTWLIGILKHKWIDHLRKEIRQREGEKLAEGDPTAWFDPNHGTWREKYGSWPENPESLYQSEQFMSVLSQCADKLPYKQKMVFRMRELHGMDADEICNVFALSTSNLHVLLHRARLGLRHCLDRRWFAGTKGE